MNNRSNHTLHITKAAVIAALYVIFTFISSLFGLSGGVIQLRLSEMLTILPAFTPCAIPGLFIGCLLSNLLTGCAPWDVLFGGLATLLGAVGTYLLKRTPLSAKASSCSEPTADHHTTTQLSSCNEPAADHHTTTQLSSCNESAADHHTTTQLSSCNEPAADHHTTKLPASGSAFRKWLLTLPPIAANTITVPFVLAYVYGAEGTIPFFMLTVGIGEFLSCGILGMLIYPLCARQLKHLW